MCHSPHNSLLKTSFHGAFDALKRAACRRLAALLEHGRDRAACEPFLARDSRLLINEWFGALLLFFAQHFSIFGLTTQNPHAHILIYVVMCKNTASKAV